MSTIIRTRSPFFIRTPEETSSDLNYFEIVISLFSGDLADKTIPLCEDFSESITLTKKPINNENSVSVEINEIVNSYLSQNINPANIKDPYRKRQSMWVDVSTRPYKADGTAITTATVNTYLAQEGYNDFTDGVNYTTNPNAMMTANYIQFQKGDTISIPVNAELVNKVEYININGGVAQTDNISFTNDAADVINYSTANTSTFSKSIKSVIITYDTSSTRTIQVEQLEECKYPIFKCTFLNKFGAYQDVIFFKKSTESLETKRENYNRSVFHANYAYKETSGQSCLNKNNYNTYSLNEHSNQSFNTNGIETLQLNTGFVNELMNETFKELLVSEYVYLTDSSGSRYPVNLKDSSLTYKTSLNDKMINYTMSFEKSFSYINNVR